MAGVWKLADPAAQKIVLLKLADCANDAGANAFPSVATMARECGLSERSVQNALRRLTSSGRIDVQAPATRYTSTIYRVMGARGAPLAGPGVRHPDGARGANNDGSGVHVERIMGAGGAPDPLKRSIKEIRQENRRRERDQDLASKKDQDLALSGLPVVADHRAVEAGGESSNATPALQRPPGGDPVDPG